MTSTPDAAAGRRRGRWGLLALLALFLGPILLAMVLGWLQMAPQGTRNKGQWLKPYLDLRAETPRLADGSEYPWQPQQRLWRLVALAPADCDAGCRATATDLDKVWQLFGREADRVHILWTGPLPDPRGASAEAWRSLPADADWLQKLPRTGETAGVPVYIVDPNGFVILRYAPGFDPADLRADMARLLKLM
ncbi:hypothetical protein CSC70_01095 [Pseudoxanthomonas kalamensis DSM 18571]|uniref:hypothetical protein n=1 Tax=Pseudoxanthomonas kalamensis TaxID=289483 RepID=UPI001391558A|nr:hypothetical protein [Pseudoxanthomonas kalamensis]KAF1712159.1 hypothetical protein CSC70_01095 [Pseudoxanthomonas kalamensis DSM 18571]